MVILVVIFSSVEHHRYGRHFKSCLLFGTW